MMRSLFSGISGLRVHQTKMDVIANNISNVNTVGFKSSRVTFNEVFAQTLSGASSPNEGLMRGGTNAMQIGLGANVASIDMLMTTGAAQRTDNPFDVMIQGDGFFIVSTGDTKYYTRAGAFRVDEFGYLTMPNGYIVNGWNINPDPTSDTKFDVDKSSVVPLQIAGDKEFSPPRLTDHVEYKGNMNAIEDGTTGLYNSIPFFDSLGNKYTVDVKYTYNTTTKDWSAEFADVMYPNGDRSKGIWIDVTTGGAAGDTGQAEITIETKDLSTLTPTSTPPYDPANGIYPWSNEPSIAVPQTFKFTTAGRLDDAVGISGFDITIDDTTGNAISPDAAFGQPIVVEFGLLTQYQMKSDMLASTKNGHMGGTLLGLSIGSDGKITGRYSNGQTKELAQIVLAQFKNPAGLEREGSNLFSITNNSGDAQVGEPAAGGSSLLGGVLEMANVDLASEFTEMITTQRGFQANSRVITTSDEMLQELVNLKR